MILVILCCLLFIAMTVYPFWPGYKELKKGEDNENLYIKRDYIRDPRYFGLSFRKLLTPFLPEARRLPVGVTLAIDLSKKEALTVGPVAAVQAIVEERMTLFPQAAVLPPQSQFAKEIYALSDLAIGSDSTVRAVAGNADCRLATGTEIIRWLDVEGNLLVAADCNLGLSASSRQKIVLGGKNCLFKRLFAPIIEIGTANALKTDFTFAGMQQYPAYSDVVYDIKKIKEAAVFNKNIVTHKKMVVRQDTVVLGNIKAYKELLLEENVKIIGNIFCEGDLIIQNSCRITGTVFVQGNLKVSNNVSFGEKGKIKSVIVRKDVTLGSGVVLHGFVLTEGVGKTV